MPGLDMMPTTLTSGIQEELLVSFRPQDRARNDCGLEAERTHRVVDASAGLLVQRWLANNSSFAYLLAFEFKLRLYQDNHFCVLGKQARQRWKNHSRGNETDIHHRKFDRFWHIACTEKAGIELFFRNHPRIGAKFPIELRRTCVDRVHARSAALQQTIRKSAGGCADVQADLALRDRKSTRLNSSHPSISYAVFCLKKKKNYFTKY